MMKNKTLLYGFLAVVIAIVGISLFAYLNKPTTTPTPEGQIIEISSFEECAAAGNPVMQSYPPRCKTADGKTFTQGLPAWKTDGITMMRIPETGNLACFGCGATECRDPIPTLEVVEETEEQHCTATFEIEKSEKASPLSRLLPIVIISVVSIGVIFFIIRRLRKKKDSIV
jgi:hypothetical protein